jgi:hypothetical protein
VPSANRSIITWKRNEREKKWEKNWHIDMFGIYLFLYWRRTKDRRSGERTRERKRSREGEKDSTALQPTLRAHHHIIQFASISTRSSNSSSSSSSNEHEWEWQFHMLIVKLS